MGPELPDMPGRADGRSATPTLVVGGAVILLLGSGWFVWSHFVMETAPADAFGEALGVVLGLLILASVIGAVTASRE